MGRWANSLIRSRSTSNAASIINTTKSTTMQLALSSKINVSKTFAAKVRSIRYQDGQYGRGRAPNAPELRVILDSWLGTAM